MARRRRPSNLRFGPVLSPPMAETMRLRLAYRREIDTWYRSALEIADTWTVRGDAAQWIRDKMRALRVTISGAERGVARDIDLVAHRTTRRSDDFFSRALPLVALKREVPKKLIASFRDANVARIKSIGAERLAEIEDLLEEADAKGWRVEQLKKKFREQFDVSKSKAELLARDQTLKLQAAITKTRQTQAGISKYQWSTSGDERVRATHEDLDGTIQNWDDPPVTNENGDRNHPGEDYQCRCIPRPILPDLKSVDEE